MASLEEVNAKLKQACHSLLQEKATLAAGLKQKLAALISQKNAFLKKAEELQLQNEKVMQHIQRKSSGAIKQLPPQVLQRAQAVQGTPEELRVRITQLENEKKLIHTKIKGKLQQLVTEKYELSQRMKQLEQAQINPLELQQLRQQLAMLMNEKINLSQKNASQNAALQNAQMWLAQNKQLQQQLDRMKKENEITLAKIEAVRSEYTTKVAETQASKNMMDALSATNAEYAKRLEEERASQRNAAAWMQQNEHLRNKIAKLVNLNKILAAKVSDAQATAEGNEAAATSESTELTKQCATNVTTNAQLAEAIQRIEAETTNLTTSVPEHENEKANLIAEVTGLQMQIRQLNRKSEERSKKRDKNRSEVLELQMVTNDLILQVEELNAELKNVEEWDRQNDELRYALQESLDENARLVERLERLENEELSDNGVESDLDNIAAELMRGDGSASGSGTTGAGPGDATTGDDTSPESTLERKRRARESRRKDTLGRLEKRLSSLSMLTETKEKDTSKAERLKNTYHTLKRGAAGEDLQKRIKEEAEKQVDAKSSSHAQSERTYEDGEDTDDIKFVHDEANAGSRYPQIKAATIEKLVERLTYEKFPDTEYVQAFMLTYRSFTTPLDLLELIIQRYCITPREGLTPEELKEFKSKKQIPIRLRVFNVLRGWINDYFYDFRSDQLLVDTVMDFVENTMPATGMERPSKSLKKALLRKLQEAEEERTINMDIESVPPVRPKDRLATFVKSADCKIMAKVITRIEAFIYKNIEPRECFGLAWSKKNKERDSPNILKLVRRFNETSNWVQWEILVGSGSSGSGSTPSSRAKTFKKFIKLAKELRALNNFNGAMAVLAGLSASPIHRLKATKARVDSKTQEVMSSLQEELSSSQNFKMMRKAIHMANPPCIPYLGMYLTDLTFIEDGNSDEVGGLLNFTKRRYYANVLQEVQRYQQLGYDLDPDHPHYDYLERAMTRASQEITDEGVAYDLSLSVEPRGTT